MDKNYKAKRSFLKWGIIIFSFIITIVCLQIMFSHPPFDADKIAAAETKMWQAYYSKDKIQLAMNIISLLRNQHSLTLLNAKKIGELLAASAIKFQSASGNYEYAALPDLINAYTLIKQTSGAAFDPEKAARAELAWWVARRTPGQNSAEQVGEKITELYTILYGKTNPEIQKAGLLRAKAAVLRDSGQDKADWIQVESLLKQSYSELKKGIYENIRL